MLSFFCLKIEFQNVVDTKVCTISFILPFYPSLPTQTSLFIFPVHLWLTHILNIYFLWKQIVLVYCSVVRQHLLSVLPKLLLGLVRNEIMWLYKRTSLFCKDLFQDNEVTHPFLLNDKMSVSFCVALRQITCVSCLLICFTKLMLKLPHHLFTMEVNYHWRNFPALGIQTEQRECRWYLLPSSLTSAPWHPVNLEELSTLSSFMCDFTWEYDNPFSHILFD